MEMQPATTEKVVHVHAMCTRPFLLLNSKSLDTRLQELMNAVASPFNMAFFFQVYNIQSSYPLRI